MQDARYFLRKQKLDKISQKEQKYFLSVCLNQEFVRDKSLSNGLSCVLARVACLACQRAKHAIRDMRPISAMPDQLYFLNYSQIRYFNNIRTFFAIDRCLPSKSKFIFILSTFLFLK